MSEIGSLRVNLECESDEFLAKMNAARAALEGVAKAADEAAAALTRFQVTQNEVVAARSDVDDIASLLKQAAAK